MEGILTAVSSSNGAIGCTVHARGCTVVVGYSVETHVL